MSRRFLNLVLRCNGSLYTVNQLDTSNLFYKSAAAAASRKKNGYKKMEEEIPKLHRLPASSFNFQPFRSNFYETLRGADLFAPFGKEGMILCCDGVGQTVVYDPSSHSMQVMPMMNAPKGPMSIVCPLDRTKAHATSSATCDPNSTVARESFIYNWIKGEHSESLYIMDMAPRCPFSFEMLSFSSKGWLWRALPPPPFLDPGCKARRDSCAVVNSNTIFLSPSTHDGVIGTYCFDTVTHEWCKAGDWVLPFQGRAEFFPELGHWIGFSHCSPYHICAVSSLDPPEVVHSWSDLDPPEGWSLLDLYLVNLGSGRFCTVKFFDVRDPSYGDGVINDVVVFTGVEVVRNTNQTGGIGFEMLKHKSKCVINVDLKCVL